jgi:hypothetical protein
VRIADICLPKHQVQFRTVFNPQDEEFKEKDNFTQNLAQSTQQFIELMTAVEHETLH